MEAGADAGAGPEGGLVLRVEDLDGSLLSDPVAHLVGRARDKISFTQDDTLSEKVSYFFKLL